jgi:hypothetical protein
MANVGYLGKIRNLEVKHRVRIDLLAISSRARLHNPLDNCCSKFHPDNLVEQRNNNVISGRECATNRLAFKFWFK